MERGIIKMVIIIMIIAITLLSGSMFLAMRYGGLMMESAVSDKVNQESEAGASE